MQEINTPVWSFLNAKKKNIMEFLNSNYNSIPQNKLNDYKVCIEKIIEKKNLIFPFDTSKTSFEAAIFNTLMLNKNLSVFDRIKITVDYNLLDFAKRELSLCNQQIVRVCKTKP